MERCKTMLFFVYSKLTINTCFPEHTCLLKTQKFMLEQSQGYLFKILKTRSYTGKAMSGTRPMLETKRFQELRTNPLRKTKRLSKPDAAYFTTATCRREINGITATAEPKPSYVTRFTLHNLSLHSNVKMKIQWRTATWT